MKSLLKKILTGVLVTFIITLGVSAVMLPIAAWFLLARRWFYVIAGIYCLLSFCVTWRMGDELGEDGEFSLFLCAVKLIVLVFCVDSIWRHIVAPELFIGGMPQSTSTDMEFFVLSVYWLEAVGVLIRLFYNYCIEPLAEKLDLDFFI